MNQLALERWPPAWSLRSGVELARETEDDASLMDRETGLRLRISAGAAAVLTSILEGTLAPDHDDAIAGFVAQLAALHLLARANEAGAERTEIERAQGLYLLDGYTHAGEQRLLAFAPHAEKTTALHRELYSGRERGEPMHWPILQKEDLRRHFPAGVVAEGQDVAALLRAGDLVVASTSGSTGTRLQTYSDTRIERLPPSFAELWNWPARALDAPLRTAVLTSPICSGSTCTRQARPRAQRIVHEHTLFLESSARPHELSRRELETMLQELREFAPQLWVVHPVYLAALLRKTQLWSLELPPVQAVLVGFQYISQLHRKLFARALAAPVYDMYSATELGGSQVAIGCPHGRLHVRTDQVFVELLRDGVRVEPGELGHVTVSVFNPTLPLVRYALRDLARFAPTPCACAVGSAWPTLTLEGRAADAFARPNGVITTRAVDDSLAGLELELYRVLEYTPGKFRVALVLASDLDAASVCSQVHTRLAALLQPDELLVERVRALQLDESQKFRFTVPFTP